MSGRENVVAALACGLTGDIVRTFGEVRLRVFGTSMVPAILPGDLISVQRAAVPEISIGEIVLYSRDGRLFVHRVVGAAHDSGETRLITRGDRLRYDDPAISAAEVAGRVICVERGGRKVNFAARNGEWMRPLIRLLRASDFATNLYVRIASFSGRIATRRFSRANEIPVIPNPLQRVRNPSLAQRNDGEIPRHFVPRNDGEIPRHFVPRNDAGWVDGLNEIDKSADRHSVGAARESVCRA